MFYAPAVVAEQERVKWVVASPTLVPVVPSDLETPFLSVLSEVGAEMTARASKLGVELRIERGHMISPLLDIVGCAQDRLYSRLFQS